MIKRQYIAVLLVLSLLFGQFNQLHQHNHSDNEDCELVASDSSLSEDCSICDANQAAVLKSTISLTEYISFDTDLTFIPHIQQCESLIADSKNKSPPLG